MLLWIIPNLLKMKDESQQEVIIDPQIGFDLRLLIAVY